MKKLLLITVAIMSFSGIANAYYYYLGPFEVFTSSRIPPSGTKGLVDLSCRDIPNVAFIASASPLGSGYTLLGEGDMETIDVNLAMRVKWRNVMDYLPRGSKLADLLWDQLTDGSDPTGITAPKPLIPTSKGKLNLRMGKVGLVKSENFTWGDFHTNKIKARILIDLWRARQAALDGKLRNPVTKEIDYDYHRRILKGYCDKYKVAWTEIRPANWPLSEDPLSRNTVISDDFDCGDSSTLGCDLTWTDIQGDFRNSSNHAYTPASTPWNLARADSDLSTDDMYVQAHLVTGFGSGTGRVFGRKDSSSDLTFYSGTVTGSGHDISKYSGGSPTSLISDAEGGADVQIKLVIDGSDLYLYQDSVLKLSTTDTDITGNLRAGIGNGASWNDDGLDDFEAGDYTGEEEPPAGGATHERRRVIVAQ
jgi:hypothetical protein